MRSHRLTRHRGRTIIDLLAMLFIIVLLAAVLAPLVRAANVANDKIKCAANLRHIAQAMLDYSNENKGSYPRTIYDPARADKPTFYSHPDSGNPFGDDAVGANDVTAAIYLLIRTQDIGPKDFICPATRDTTFDFGGRNSGKTAADFANFPARKYLSYSFSDPYPSKEAVKKGYKWDNSVDHTFVVAADMNPGVKDLLKLNTDSKAEDLAQGNSTNHGREGQNILYADGHTEFLSYPFAGMNWDNIYTYGESGKGHDKGGAGIIGSPVNGDDSVLLPTAQ